MNAINLQRFCAIDDIRTHLMQPWHFDGWVYASNGHIAVRVPYTGDASIPDATSRHPKTIPGLFAKWCSDGADYAPMPALPEGKVCEACGGHGFFPAVKCLSCNGEGVIVYAAYEYDCKACDRDLIEEGWRTTEGEPEAMKVCLKCWGRKLEMHKVPLGGAEFELAYLLWLAELPGVTFRTNGTTGAAGFKFDGGEALLMPRHH